MVAEAEVFCHTAVAVNCLSLLSEKPAVGFSSNFMDVLPADSDAAPVTIDFSRCETSGSCSTSGAVFQTPTRRFCPRIRSGSHTDIGHRSSNEDTHIQIDDLVTHLGSLSTWSEPASFFAIFDGHGGSGASAYMKKNAIRFFFEDAELPRRSDINEAFFDDLESYLRRSFLLADQALIDEHIDSYCGTTALTALILGRHLLIANAGDCRAVLCRKGDAIQLSQDHRPSCQLEQKRILDLGGTIDYGYLNGELAVTRALGDWFMKLPLGSVSPLTAEPEFQRTLLNEDDEFLILACDGIWDVVSNQEAVSLVRRELRRHNNNPQHCARELINHALKQGTCDNVTAIVVCFSSPESQESVSSQRPSRLRFCMSEAARNKLRSLLEDC